MIKISKIIKEIRILVLLTEPTRRLFNRCLAKRCLISILDFLLLYLFHLLHLGQTVSWVVSIFVKHYVIILLTELIAHCFFFGNVELTNQLKSTDDKEIEANPKHHTPTKCHYKGIRPPKDHEC